MAATGRGHGPGRRLLHGRLGQAADRAPRPLAGPVAEALEVADRPGLEEREEAEERPRGEGRTAGAGRHRPARRRTRPRPVAPGSSASAGRADPVPPASAPAARLRTDDDHELPEDQGHQGVDQAATPVGDGRPGQTGQGQGQEQDRHVDGGGPDEQLDPHHHRADHHGQGAEEDDEGRGAGWPAAAGRPERPVRTEDMKWPASSPAPLGHRGAHGVGDRQSELHQLDGDRGQQHGQGDVDQDRAQQHERFCR